MKVYCVYRCCCGASVHSTPSPEYLSRCAQCTACKGRRKVTFRFVFVRRLYHRSTPQRAGAWIIMEMRMGVRAPCICINFPVHSILHAHWIPNCAVCTICERGPRENCTRNMVWTWWMRSRKYFLQSDSEAENLKRKKKKKIPMKMVPPKYVRRNWLFISTFSHSQLAIGAYLNGERKGETKIDEDRIQPMKSKWN